MRIFLMTPVGVVVTTRGRERVKELWEKEDRPKKYQDPNQIKKLWQATAFALHKPFTEKNKQRKGTNYEAFSKLKKLKESKFGKGKDDGYMEVGQSACQAD